jgi:hypothetical protein
MKLSRRPLAFGVGIGIGWKCQTTGWKSTESITGEIFWTSPSAFCLNVIDKAIVIKPQVCYNEASSSVPHCRQGKSPPSN